jgi:hypothetical protein
VHGDEKKRLIWVLMVVLELPAEPKSLGFVARKSRRISVGWILPGNHMKFGEIVYRRLGDVEFALQ